MTDDIDLVTTGAGGRLGRFLRAAWTAEPPDGIRPLWTTRSGGFGLAWDILAEPAPAWPAGAVVLHLAGVVRGDEAQLAANVDMARAVLRACHANRARALLFASTAAVYAPAAEPSPEDTAVNPQNGYGRSKAAAERVLLADRSGLPVHILRLGNIAGAESLLGPRRGDAPIVLDPVPGRDGGPVRSWIGPVTLARVLACLARRSVAGGLAPILNIAAAPPLPMAALLRASGRAWSYGPANPSVVPVATLAAGRLHAICPLPPATPEALVAEIARLSDAVL